MLKDTTRKDLLLTLHLHWYFPCHRQKRTNDREKNPCRKVQSVCFECARSTNEKVEPLIVDKQKREREEKKEGRTKEKRKIELMTGDAVHM